MEFVLESPANLSVFGIPSWVFFVLIPVVAAGIFTYIIARRLAPMVLAAPDNRLNNIPLRIWTMLKYAVAQYRQPRYMTAGVLHILIFAGFVIISLHSITLVMSGIKPGFTLPFLGHEWTSGVIYGVLKDSIATAVLVAALIAAVRRGMFTPERYAVPEKYGKDHTFEAVFILLMISGLMVSDAIFEGSAIAAERAAGHDTAVVVPLTLNWLFAGVFGGMSVAALQAFHTLGYVAHELIFFSFLNILPQGKHFHVITSLPNVFLAKLPKGTVKPVKWGVDEESIAEAESIGVKHFRDFTWKHILDFYSCADCGRCSDHCPANAAGRPLSPRFISIKCRDYAFSHYPLRGPMKKSEPLLEGTLEPDEIWSCTTCGACEEECPLLIEYIDKVVDVRRGMVDDGMVPQSLQKPLGAMEKRGNPYGITEKKRADWASALKKEEEIPVKVVGKKESAETLYFVDSITSYDDRMQGIARATARILTTCGEDFGILGPGEKDSGHEVRRFGEEMLFFELRDHNTDKIAQSGAKRIVTADPHAFNCLTKDYENLPPAEHIAQYLKRMIDEGKIKLKPVESGKKTYVYHDPCYLGRHNHLYDAPRAVLDAVPGIHRVEMDRCRDRSFCCGGGGLMLYYEPPDEETRMGKIRVEMAKETGADVIVTACPFCLVNLEDAVKTSGLEGKMEVIDLAELIDRHIDRG